jgi:ferrous iron transport protein B
VGNPNVGKSAVFNMLSNQYTEVSNYPGATVAVATARIHHIGTLIDTPGIYSLTGASQIEEITKKHVSEADVVINVVNATTLDRDLILTKQLLETYPDKTVLVINQVDESEKRGIDINYEGLSETLGVEVVKAVAINGIGKKEIFHAIAHSIHHSHNSHHHIPSHVSSSPLPLHHRYGADGSHGSHASSKIDEFLLNPIIGWAIVIFVLYALFKILGDVIAGNIVDSLVSVIDKFYVPTVSKFVSDILGNTFWAEMLVGEFGILTMTVKMVFGILMPLIIGFYTIMSLLEDSGYIPRIAVLTSKFFNFLGLNGDAIIPILLGFGCGALGTISCRILRTKKEQIIVTTLIGIAIPCAAQQCIIISLLAATNDVSVWSTYVAVMLMVTILSCKILNMFIEETCEDFIMDIPPLRIPSITHCYRKTMYRAKSFLRETVSVFVISSGVITILHKWEILSWLQLSLSPIVENLLHLPKEFADVFVMGIIRRDLAAIGVFDMSQKLLTTGAQILTAAVVISLFVPCINAIVVILKERGWKMALTLWISAFVISISVGAVLTRVCEGILCI